MKFKSITDILGRLIDVTMIHTSELTDFTPGSIVRSIYDAVAEELESYYMLTQENILAGIANGITQAFGFDKREAIAAYGTVTVDFYNILSQDFVLPQGTTFYSDVSGYNQTYSTITPIRIPANSMSATVPVYCTVTGTIGNIPAGFINRIKTTVSNISVVTNQYALSTGQDEESDANLRSRFRRFILALGRATVKSIDYGTRSVENVTGVYVYEEPGMITVYAHDANGNLSDDLKNSILKTLDGDGTMNQGIMDDYKPAGVPLQVLAIDKNNVDLIVSVTVNNIDNDTVNLENTIIAKVQNSINTLTAGQDLILNYLVSQVMQVDSKIIVDVQITQPISDDLNTQLSNLQDNISTATTALQNMNLLVATTQNDVSVTLPNILAIGADTIITPTDKVTLNALLATINSNYISDTALMHTYSVSYATYVNAYNNVVTYINSIAADSESQTTIDYTTYQSTFAQYFDSRVSFSYLVQEAANTILNSYNTELVDLNQKIYEYEHSNIIAEPSQLIRSGTVTLDIDAQAS